MQREHPSLKRGSSLCAQPTDGGHDFTNAVACVKAQRDIAQSRHGTKAKITSGLKYSAKFTQFCSNLRRLREPGEKCFSWPGLVMLPIHLIGKHLQSPTFAFVQGLEAHGWFAEP